MKTRLIHDDIYILIDRDEAKLEIDNDRYCITGSIKEVVIDGNTIKTTNISQIVLPVNNTVVFYEE